MTEQNKSDQTPTGQTENKPTTGQQTGQQQDQQNRTPSETGEAQGGSAATGEAQDAETLTQTGEPTGEQTGENAGGFVASKKEDESGYLQGERKSESDIEGSSIKKDDQTS